ncbi:MAG TPA: UDP-N-acetylmuramate dehydrogenase [Candidatus Sulfotelmatobacter sp.]|jgi:UDP-N-acetylenolpyruvoylglucosamine reductase|nr:UDP-N-acetylmuramate dehydrogenase [Candidatus Sulfotelmatobacter sp.]
MNPVNSTSFATELTACVSPATVIKRDEPMAKHTTLRVGGPADWYVEPASEDDLAAVLKYCAGHGLKFFILGRGSNLVVRDGGFRGVMICLSQPAFSKIEITGDKIIAGAGAKQKNVAVEAKRAGLSGVEFLEGIPGSIGGALRMNAGAMGGETFNAVESVRVMDHNGEIREMKPAEMSVTYRCCAMLKDKIALAAVFSCKPEPRAVIETRMKAYSEKRWSSQPAAPSAGCMFKNPTGIPAGKLIDDLGLKGSSVGGAMVSLEHGNFLVNGGKATAKDVLELIVQLQAKVKVERGIELHTEVEIIGED